MKLFKFKVMQKEEDTRTESLPIEIQVMILLRLPVKSLVRFKCVWKIWLTEITSQSFIDFYNHENYPQNHDSNRRYLILVGSSSISSFDYSNGGGVVSDLALPHEFRKKLNSKIIGSCNGLLCFENLISRKILVYNPITRANRVMRISAFPDAYKGYKVGFGYNHKSNDYKILWVSWEKVAYIFRLKSNTNEEIKCTPPLEWHFGSFRKRKPSTVYSNNALHWVGPEIRGARGSIISCFDIGSEQFYELRTPRLLLDTYRSYWNIADLRGYLHFVHCFPGWSSSPSLEIWIMKEYGVRKSWTRLIKYSDFGSVFDRKIDYSWSRPNVYVYSNDNREILVKFGPYPKELLSCNLMTRKIKKVRVSVFDGVNLFDRGPKGLYVAPWCPSFIRSREGTGTRNRTDNPLSLI